MTWPQRVLMVNPRFFEVAYAINPHMRNQAGELNQVDSAKAQKQWQILHDTFQSLDLEVVTLPGQPHLPDMVFCANQTFPFRNNGQTEIILSTMASPERRPEVEFFKQWASKNGIPHHPPLTQNFEGMGDALWNYESGEIFAGYGFRTSPEVYTTLEKIVGQKITTFELKDERFYHLDTCLAILNKETAAYVEEAFTPEGLQTLRQSFTQLLRVPLHEATEQLACNMCSANGKDVILQQGATATVQQLQEHGFKVHEIDTSEFIKSGGSVFCMKMLIW
jgi:N-dimethylarginine dimethylaminohydrolase